MKRTRITTMAGLFVLPFTLILPALGAEKEAEKATHGTLDTAAIERELGKAGEAKGEVYKLSWPRTDLSVTVGDVTVKPGLGLSKLDRLYICERGRGDLRRSSAHRE